MSADAFHQTPLIIGHRGAAGLAPENTLPSFQRAVSLGVDAIELDVRRCEDAIVVIHDPTLDRTTDRRGSVATTPLATLRRADAGAGARVPLLEEVFSELPTRIGINVELKDPAVVGLLAERLPRDDARPLLVSSFDHRALEEFARLRSDCRVAPLFDRWQRRAGASAIRFGGGFINLGRRLVTAARMAELSRLGLRVLVYTVNDVREARRLIELGVAGVFTDYPDRVCRESLRD
jgi:glycerophosphoryl diester phosphodiesterase